MLNSCLICGKLVEVIGNPEIIACEDDHCARIIEDSIGLHYAQGNSLIGCDAAKTGCDISAEVVYQGGKAVKVSYMA